MNPDKEQIAVSRIESYQADWNLFASEVLGVNLDQEQRDILTAVQNERMISVRSGTARGKDFVGAVCSICFLYLTPRWNTKEEMISNTKVAMTAPTDRQIKNIMYPEVVKLYKRAKTELHGRLSAYDIRTNWEEWFLTGFKADEHNQEAWTGFHADNTMFVVTEASGIAENIWTAIEGNLQGNSRLLIIFNPNRSTGYAAQSQKSKRFKKFALNSLNAENVVKKEKIIPGQVDYEWIKDKVETWCQKIDAEKADKTKGDFEFEGSWYHPNDRFRVKVLAMFPEVDSDVLIPPTWIEAANERWKHFVEQNFAIQDPLRLGVDVSGMGTDTTVFCSRYGDFVKKLEQFHSHGEFKHMEFAGRVKNELKLNASIANIDTIGEGAGVYSRLVEEGVENAYSAKASHKATSKDVTGEYEFVNMRAQMFWAVRDWLNPEFDSKAMLPPDDELAEELSAITYSFDGSGRIILAKKDDIKEDLGRSPDKADSLALTFYPNNKVTSMNYDDIAGMFG